MAQPTMHAQMGGEISGSEELIQAGAVTLELEYRLLPGRTDCGRKTAFVCEPE
jgi:hypothetical protein